MARREIRGLTNVVDKPLTTVEPEIVDAVVDGVDFMLNIRSTPEVKDDNIITSVKKGTVIQVVDPEKTEGKFYKIIVTDPPKKTEGYGMKKYIKII